MCFGGWMQSCPCLSVCFSHCCININPAVFSSLWRKAWVFFFFIGKGKWDTVFFSALSLPFVLIFFVFFYFLVNPGVLYAEMCPAFHCVERFPGWFPPPPCPPFKWASEQWISGKCVLWYASIIHYFSLLGNPRALLWGRNVTSEQGVPTLHFTGGGGRALGRGPAWGLQGVRGWKETSHVIDILFQDCLFRPHRGGRVCGL